jgi:hypothetical protein
MIASMASVVMNAVLVIVVPPEVAAAATATI